jgi:hypothetical protein
MGVGTRVREVGHFLGLRIELAWEVTEFEPYKTSAIKGVSGRSRSAAVTSSSRSTVVRSSP